MGHVAIFRNNFQALDRLCVADNIIQEDRSIFLNPREEKNMLVFGIVVAAAAAVFVVVGALLPSRWRASRTAVVRATPEAIYPLIADFARGWTRWSPFGRAKDPTLEFEYFGPESGIGAGQRW